MTKAEAVNKSKEIFINKIEELRVSQFVPNITTRGKSSTGNLAFNSLRYTEQSSGVNFYVDETIAPYMIYTNEPWSKGVNPNQNWWERFAKELLKRYENGLKDLEK